MKTEKIEGFDVVIERKDDGYHATVPKLPGCKAKADGMEEVRRAITRHIGYYLSDIAGRKPDVKSSPPAKKPEKNMVKK